MIACVGATNPNVKAKTSEESESAKGRENGTAPIIWWCNISYTQKLFYQRNIYDLESTNMLFLHAIIENVKHHMESCPEYAKILERRGFSLGEIERIEDVYKIPSVPTAFLVLYKLLAFATLEVCRI